MPPAGDLQSSGSVGPRLRVDFLASSDTPLDVGGRPTNRPRDALGGGTGGNLSAPAGGGGAAATAAVAAADAAGKGIGMAMRRRRLRAVRCRLCTDDAASSDLLERGDALILSAGDKTVHDGDEDVHAFPRCQRGKPNLHWASLPSEHFVRHSNV